MQLKEKDILYSIETKLNSYQNSFNKVVLECIHKDLLHFLDDSIMFSHSHLTYLDSKKIVHKKYDNIVKITISGINKNKYTIRKNDIDVNKYCNHIELFASFVQSIDRHFEFNYNRDIPLFDYHLKIYKGNYLKILHSLNNNL